MNVPITEIVVGERRREDMGDIGELAASIDRYGLIHPIVVDERHALIAGGRRLAACKKLGWDHVEVRYFVTLTDAEKREIELEENVRRKDLSSLERDKRRVELADIAAEINKDKFRPDSGQNSEGRPATPDSVRSVAARTGMAKSVIHDARAHVAAVERHPELADLSQREAI